MRPTGRIRVTASGESPESSEVSEDSEEYDEQRSTRPLSEMSIDELVVRYRELEGEEARAAVNTD